VCGLTNAYCNIITQYGTSARGLVLLEPVTAILGRLAEVVGAANQTELANRLGVTQSTVSSWRSRGTIPIKQLIEVAESKHVSLDYLLLGKSPKIDLNLLGQILVALSAEGSAHSTDDGRDFGYFAALVYNKVSQVEPRRRPAEILETIELLNSIKEAQGAWFVLTEWAPSKLEERGIHEPESAKRGMESIRRFAGDVIENMPDEFFDFLGRWGPGTKAEKVFLGESVPSVTSDKGGSSKDGEKSSPADG
jgi:transcriptional regulator with XRE-family HTH domain